MELRGLAVTWRGDEDDRERVRLIYRKIWEAQRGQDVKADTVRVVRHADGVTLHGPAEAIADVAAVLLEAAQWVRRDDHSGRLGALGVAILAALARREPEQSAEELLRAATLREK